jgi:hypothetical protein
MVSCWGGGDGKVSRYLGIAPNRMFMAMPDAYFPHRLDALGLRVNPGLRNRSAHLT